MLVIIKDLHCGTVRICRIIKDWVMIQNIFMNAKKCLCVLMPIQPSDLDPVKNPGEEKM